HFALNVINLTEGFPNKRLGWIITDQIIRSATSIGANLTEGRSSSSRLEYKRYYEIALRSANETLFWLQLSRDASIVKKEHVTILLKECNEIARMLASAVIKLRRPKS
ncbi:MAG: four helix bundle protein, partial [Patescibacteria group bacterium]|nr:four helix bundle protein [Patescibacteria group bacterium]